MKLSTIARNIKNLRELDYADLKFAGKDAFRDKGCINAMGVLKKEVLQGLKDIKHIQDGGEVVQGFVNHGEVQKGFIKDNGEYRFSPHALKYHRKMDKKTNSVEPIGMLI